MLSLGLAVIFGLLNIINFTHGAQYMMGAFCAWFLLEQAGASATGGRCCSRRSSSASTGVVIERTMLSRLYKLDHLYGLLLTFGLALIIQGVFTQLLRQRPDSRTGCREEFSGAFNLGFMFLPKYRAWVIVASLDRLPRRPGSSSSAPSSAPICARRPRIRRWCRRSASTCRG